MKTGKEKRDPSIIDHLFVVNKSAGRLRLVLLLLFFFIVWSFVAQSRLSLPPFLDIFITFFPEPTNFTSGIIQEILFTYLSPTTIIFTLIPIIIFLSIRQIITRFLHALLPAIEPKSIERYLNNCAFSFSPRYYDISSQEKFKCRHAIQELTKLGGPAKITFRSDSIPIILDIEGNTSSFHFPRWNTDKYDHFLCHGELIESITTKNDVEIFYDQISVKDGFERHIQLNKIGFKIDFDHSSGKPQALVSHHLSKSDALVFHNLEKSRKEMITSFILNEVKNFLKFEPSVIDWGGILVANKHRDQIATADPLKIHAHSTYQNIIPVGQLLNKKISRKHKHSIYPYLHKKGAIIENSEERQRETDKIEQMLLLYLNEQFRSFFHTSNILISLLEMGEIKINDKNHILH
jgi:hypothetical protein